MKAFSKLSQPHFMQSISRFKMESTVYDFSYKK